jgi:hypothetical protein
MNISPRMSKFSSWSRRNVLFAAGTVTALLFCGWAVSRAQQPAPPNATTAQGIVQNFTTAPRGEVDGAVLDNGIRLHWPPHLQGRFRDILVQGDQVRATGRSETGPAGDTHFEIQNLTDLRTNASAENPDFAAGPPAPPLGPRDRARRMGPPAPPLNGPAGIAANNQDVRTIAGTVRNMNTAPRGETDGALLDNGVLLHWPPHLQDQFRNMITVGDRVQATGRMETGPAADTHFEVQSVTDLRSNATAANPDFVATLPPANLGSPVLDPAPGIPVALELRLRNLEKRMDQLQHDIERLREAR